jgi:hypothetical protein
MLTQRSGIKFEASARDSRYSCRDDIAEEATGCREDIFSAVVQIPDTMLTVTRNQEHNQSIFEQAINQFKHPRSAASYKFSVYVSGFKGR